MGGNAFDGLKRFDKKEYDEHFERISNWLGKWYIHDRTKSYSEKDSFGDLDIIVSINIENLDNEIEFNVFDRTGWEKVSQDINYIRSF